MKFFNYSTSENTARVASYLIAIGYAFTFNGKHIQFTMGEESFQRMLDTDKTIKSYTFRKTNYPTPNLM